MMVAEEVGRRGRVEWAGRRVCGRCRRAGAERHPPQFHDIPDFEVLNVTSTRPQPDDPDFERVSLVNVLPASFDTPPMTSTGDDGTPNSRKRTQPDDASTPTSAKKRKIDDGPNQPSAATRTFGSIASAVGNAFGFGARPPVSNAPSNSPGAASQSPAVKPRPAIKLAALKGTIWDKQEKPRLGASPSKGTPTKSSASKAKPTPKSAARRAPAADSPTKKRPVGRPRKTPVAPVREPAEDTQDETDSVDELAGPEPSATPSSVQKQASVKRLWGAPTPKGILTPSKNRAQTPKSVKFDKQPDADLFFEDLPTAKKPAAKITKEKEPDIVCGLCAKAHSRPPNEIILCDNCDYAVHQQCYGVEEIPEGDWLCKGCAQDDVLEAPVDVDTAPTVPARAADVPDIPNIDQHLRSLQRVLLDRCAGRRRIDMFGLQEVYEKARQMVEQTVVAGEGNSMLLIGGRGSGKSTMLENIIDEMSTEHRDEFHVVRLNGFIHTDDKLALKEIWRQLGKEMDVEDDLLGRTNYADTMASLLALLSHPSEILGTDHGVTSQSIIFIIDEFDLFAAHPRQTLLYNLFDVAQSRKAPIAVLGCTTRLNVVEMLEKRVKSRFSHRYVYLTMPKSLPGFWQVCKQGLLVEKKDAEKEGIDMSLEGYSEFQKYWNSKIDVSGDGEKGGERTLIRTPGTL